MDTRVLRYFLAAAQEKNITRAAALVHITQPSLSRQLMQLEEQLGVQLFRRTRHRIVLTDAGRLFRRRAQEIVDLAEKAEMEMRQEGETLTGRISIGCGETENMGCLAKVMADFHRQHPGVAFQLYTAVADRVKELIEGGVLDMGLLIEPVEIDTYSYVKMPLEESWCLLLRCDSPLAEKEVLGPEDLLSTPVIIPERRPVHNQLANWLGDVYDKLDIAAVCNLSYSNRSILVEQGVGAALVHRFEGLRPGLCLRPIDAGFSNGCVLAWKNGQPMSSLLTCFIQEVKNAI